MFTCDFFYDVYPNILIICFVSSQKETNVIYIILYLDFPVFCESLQRNSFVEKTFCWVHNRDSRRKFIRRRLSFGKNMFNVNIDHCYSNVYLKGIKDIRKVCKCI